jgi:hypothetical protein
MKLGMAEPAVTHKPVNARPKLPRAMQTTPPMYLVDVSSHDKMGWQTSTRGFLLKWHKE